MNEGDVITGTCSACIKYEHNHTVQKVMNLAGFKEFLEKDSKNIAPYKALHDLFIAEGQAEVGLCPRHLAVLYGVMQKRSENRKRAAKMAMNIPEVHAFEIKPDAFFYGKCGLCEKMHQDTSDKEVIDMTKMPGMDMVIKVLKLESFNICKEHLEWMHKKSIERLKEFGVNLPEKVQNLSITDMQKIVQHVNRQVDGFMEHVAENSTCGLCVKQDGDFKDKPCINIEKLTATVSKRKDAALCVREHFGIPGGADLMVCDKHYKAVADFLTEGKF